MTDVGARNVSCQLLLDVDEPADLILQIAVATNDALTVSEQLTVTGTRGEITPREIALTDAGRAHRFTTRSDTVEVLYEATVRGHATPPEVTDAESILYLRPSRYAESDRLVATAAREFAGITDSRDLITSVSSWVGTRLSYLPGISRPSDGAVQTLLAREGVCRDYAQLVVALLRANDIPSRLVAVYAPGLSPMDFHAVAEAAIDGRWYVVDATALAPRSALVRISTGRDAADTAFLSTYGGNVKLRKTEVSAFVSGTLPADDMDVLSQIT